MKTALRPENLEKRSGDVAKMENYAVFTFMLRPQYVPARFLLRPTGFHQVFTTRMITRAPRVMCSYYVLTTTKKIFLRVHHVSTTFSLRSPAPYKYCVGLPFLTFS